MSRSKQTEDAYLKRGMQIFNRYAKERSEEQMVVLDASLFVDWLEALLKGLLPPSRRLYLASVKTYLKSDNPFNGRSSIGLQEAISRLENTKACNYGGPESGRTLKRRLRTARQKAKRIDTEDLRQIMGVASVSTNQWAKWVCIWLRANMLVGLRPSEWREAKPVMVNGRPLLLVRNRKLSEERGNGPTRTIDLSLMETEDLGIIKLQLGIAGTHSKTDHDWASYYHGCRNILHKITRQLWPKRRTFPTLYSGRHQFVADAKSAGLSKEEVAALLGHAVICTAGIHYGRKRWGSGRVSVQPSQADVSRVIEREAEKESIKSKDRSQFIPKDDD